MTMLILEPFEQAEQIPEWDYQVELGEALWRIVLRWSERFEVWTLTLYDADDALQVSQETLRVNTQWGTHHTGRVPTGGEIWLVALDDSDEPCSYDDLGSRCLLMWITDDELTTTEDAAEFSYSATP